MNRHLSIIFLLTFLCLSLGFKPSIQNEYEQKVSLRIQSLHLKNLKAFLLSCRTLAAQEQQGLEEEFLKIPFLNCREKFKSCEFLLMYTDNLTSRHFNGPNLITSKFSVNTPNNLEHPHGLQVIEDLIYNPDEQSRLLLKEEIQSLIRLTEQEIAKFQKNKMADATNFNIFVFDAMRFEITRIEALGITGFDVPDSKNAISETRVALQSLHAFYQLYKPLLPKNVRKDLVRQANKVFKEAIIFTKTQADFNSFDRLTFISEFLHPLSSLFKTTTHSLEYTFFQNLDAVNREAEHLFSRDALNPLYFTPIYSEASVELGKKLFNEPLLSIDNSRSCATCHQSEKAFTDGLVKNTVISSQELLLRNTPSLYNVAYQTKFFYDSREHTLEAQALSVIHNKLEMGIDLKGVLPALKALPDYADLFSKAFAKEVDPNLLAQALADYLRTLVSLDSKVDAYFRGDQTALNASEQRGFNIFTGKANCATCHFMPLFNGLLPPFYNDTESEILGVPSKKEDQSIIDLDLGKYYMSKLDIHRFAFKTPGLKNIEFTSPYMHNGVFENLEEVVEFYNNGGGVGHGMNLSNQTLASDSLQLKKDEITDLVNFMKALSEVNY